MYPSIPVLPLSFADVFAVLGGYIHHLEQCYFQGIPPQIGEEAIDEMIKGHFLVYQLLPAVVNNDVEDPNSYPILIAPTPAHLWALRKYFEF